MTVTPWGKKSWGKNIVYLENICHRFAIRRNCSKFLGRWWIRILPLHWCSFECWDEIENPCFVSCLNAIRKILVFPFIAFRQFSTDFHSSVSVKSRQLIWELACTYFSQQQMYMYFVFTASNDKLYDDCPESAAPRAKCSQKWLPWTMIHHVRGRQ